MSLDRARVRAGGWCGPSSKSGWTSPHRRVFMRRFSRSTKALPRDVMRTWIPPTRIPCVIEPGRPCTNSGYCKKLGH